MTNPGRKRIEEIRKEYTPIVDAREGIGEAGDREIMVCTGTGCCSSGAEAIIENLKTELAAAGLSDVQVHKAGCFGFCEKGPIVKVCPEGIFYVKVKPEDAAEIVQEHFLNGTVLERLLYKDPLTGEFCHHQQDLRFYRTQVRVILRNCGWINPECIKEYIGTGGYKALADCLEGDPAEITKAVQESGLRGRGGGGFPTGKKWELTRLAQRDQKYVVCNADEGDPGAFMDRSVLEGDPHSVVEGMALAGYAVGASKGYVYVRAEYPLAVSRLRKAIEEAREYNLLGDDILGSGFSFDLEIFQGAGAFVCGESTALLMSIEGHRGMPKPTPRPRTTEAGLWGKPTVLNNVKTFSVVPQIINRGAEWFRSIGTEGSPGTAVFALTGNIELSGLIEVPMGVQIEQIVEEIGGGIPGGKEFKAVQTGGPSGGCLPKDKLGLAVDFDSLLEAGSMMGSGGMVIMDSGTCMVDVARYFLEFTFEESCGQCVPCRLGTEQMLSILRDICEGKGREGDIELLLELGDAIKKTSICGLGNSAPNPVLSTIEYFRGEYEAHIRDHRCPALVCKALIAYRINEDKCIGCGLCRRQCPVNAISGDTKVPHVIDPETCTRCGICFQSCPPKVRAVECVTGRENLAAASAKEGQDE